MIVDDEFYIRNGLAKILPWEDFGYSVIAVANDGKDALDFLAKKQPDILFTDIMMPKIDGIELTKTISEKWPTIIVIVLSSYNDFHYVKTALKNGASEYLLKPSILPENLLELVRKVCPPDHSFKQKFSYNTEKKSNKIDSLVENTFNFPYFFGFLIGENTFFTSHEIQELVTPFLINTSYKIINLQVNESYFILINHTIENFKLRLTPLKIPYIFFQNTTDLIFLKEQIELATQ
ncbi:response regulator, partial [Carnobacterium maltaromaticum]